MSDREAMIGSSSPAVGHRNYGSSDSEPPAGYDDHVVIDAPPSYESLYGRIQAARTESSGNIDFMRKLRNIICNTIGCSIVLTLTLAVPVSMIVMGSLFLNDCPREHYIPIYLIVCGVFYVIKNLIDLCWRACRSDQPEGENERPTALFDSSIGLFLTIWFITGSAWIYRISNDYDSTLNPKRPEHYCNDTLYLYAFWLTTATWIIGGILAFCVCCCFCLAVCRGEANQ